MASEYLWTGSAGDNDFGDGNNWVDTTNALPGEPGSSDVAVLEAAGPITGSGTVGGLDLISSGGTLTTQQLSVSTNSLALSGSVNLATGTQMSITDDMVVVGASSIMQSNGSSMTISGYDGTADDVVTAMTFGQNSSDNVVYLLTGLGTQLDALDGNMMIAAAGTATVKVANGATLEADNENSDGSGSISIGGAGAKGSLTVTGAYSTLELAGELNVGAGGTGHFTLNAGADAELGVDFSSAAGSGAMVVGSAAGGNGTVLVTGAGTRLGSNSYGIVAVGGNGKGVMTISAGAYANFGILEVGVGAAGSVTVTGAGTVLQLHEAAIIGNGAAGTLQVLAGAHMGMVGNTSDTLTIGSQSSSSGTLLVSGAGTVLSADNEQTQIGYSGTGHATISAGAVLNSGAPNSSASHTAVFIGTEDGSVGVATLSNAGTSWTAHGEFDVGYFGKGTLLVQSGASVTSGNYDGIAGFIEGNLAASSGVVTITGAGTRLTNNGRFIIGNAGAGTLTISTGATVTTTLPTGSTQDGAIIGGQNGGTGRVTVTGTGATWNIGADLIVGDAGSGGLTIGAGGAVHARSLQVSEAAAGIVNLSGAGASLAVTGNAKFGGTAKATVAVGSGSVLSVGGTAELANGHITMAGGKLGVTGTTTIDAGQSISGYGTIQTGGLVNTSSTVEATGGTLIITGGISGTGLLEVAGGSTLTLNNTVGSGNKVSFLAATGNLTLDAAPDFSALIANFVKGDVIDLAGIPTSSLSYSGHTLTVHETGGASLTLGFSGTYSLASFGMGSDGHGGTFITHT